MSTDGGLEGDRPFMGKTVAYQPERDRFVPAMVLTIYPDGWTVDLALPGSQENKQLVPYAGLSPEFGELEVGAWATLEEFEGWKIWADERAQKRQKEGSGEQELLAE